MLSCYFLHFEGAENANFASGGIRAKRWGIFLRRVLLGIKIAVFALNCSVHLAFIGKKIFFRYDDAFLDILPALAHLKFESKREVDGQGVRGAGGPNDECNVV